MKFDNDSIVWISGQPYSKNHPLVKGLYETKTKANVEPVGGLRNPERQPDTVPALDHSPKTHRSSKRGVGICVKIISFRRRATDLDNVIYGSKALRDSIARSLALDDGDRRIKWEYDTVITSGALGTQVLISKCTT